MLEPIIILNQLNTVNDNSSISTSVYRSMMSYFDRFVQHHVNPTARNGYSPAVLMMMYFMPSIYVLCPNTFIDIVGELHIDPIAFNRQVATVTVHIMDDNRSFLLVKDERTQMCHAYKSMMNTIAPFLNENNTYRRGPFTSSVAEVYPNKCCEYGHAVALVKANDGQFVIIDDQYAIEPLWEYINKRRAKVYSIAIMDADEETINELNAILRQYCNIDHVEIFKGRVSRRWVVVFDVTKPFDVDAECCKCKCVDEIDRLYGIVVIDDANMNVNANVDANANANVMRRRGLNGGCMECETRAMCDGGSMKVSDKDARMDRKGQWLKGGNMTHIKGMALVCCGFVLGILMAVIVIAIRRSCGWDVMESTRLNTQQTVNVRDESTTSTRT